MSNSLILLSFLAAYLLGSIPFGLLLGKWFGLGDIRKIGSGNIGATNMLRTGKKSIAATTLFLDGLKGYVAYIFCKFYLVSLLHISNDYLLLICGLLPVLGHIYPVWLHFKGGKGVATAIGVLIGIHPLSALILMVCWLSIFFVSKISSLSALTAFFVVTILANTGVKYPPENLYMPIVTLIIFYTHRENIRRLLKGEENSWRKK